MLRGIERKDEDSNGMRWGRGEGGGEGEGDDWKLERSKRNKYPSFSAPTLQFPLRCVLLGNPNQKPEGMGVQLMQPTQVSLLDFRAGGKE